MAYSPRTRDRFDLLTAGLTGLATVGVVAAAGAATGLAARQTAERDALLQQGASDQTTAGSPALEAKDAVVWLKRRHRVVVSTHVIQQTTGPGAAALGGSAPAVASGGGATATGSSGSPASSGSSGPSGSSGSSSGSGGGGVPNPPAPAPAPAPPAPPPPPPPAPPPPPPSPTSGS